MTLSDLERLIPEEKWRTMQVGRFSMDAQAFGEYQKFVETACEKNKCSRKEKKLQKKILKTMGVFNE
jgi:hypothetical protein